MAKQKTPDEFQAQVTGLVGQEYILLKPYVNSKTKVSLRHSKCGNEYEVAPNHFLNGTRCPQCFGKHKKTTAQFKEEVKSFVGDEYEVLGEYQTARKKIKMKHVICGNEYEVVPDSFLRGTRCGKCFGHNLMTTEEFKRKVYDLVGDEFTVVGEYQKAGAKVKILHNVCGTTLNIRADAFLYNGSRCQFCAGNFTKSHSQFEEEVSNLVGDEYIIQSKYEAAKQSVKMKHTTCGHTYWVTPDNFLRGRRCRYCTNMSSNERAIYDYLTEQHIDFEVEYVFENLKKEAPLRFDFKVNINKQEFFLIEYDGIHHFYGFHQPASEIQNRDHLKDNYCKDKGIHLVRIPYWEQPLIIIENTLKLYQLI